MFTSMVSEIIRKRRDCKARQCVFPEIQNSQCLITFKCYADQRQRNELFEFCFVDVVSNKTHVKCIRWRKQTIE